MPLDKDWMLHPPFNLWPYSIVHLIKHLTQLGSSQDIIIEAVKRHAPRAGWTLKTKKYVLTAIELMAEAEKKGKKDG
jgi:hypothetical protein